MTLQIDPKKYRKNVAAVILSPDYPFECKFLLAQRNDESGAWQFPQGGIDALEGARAALRRELREEIGTARVRILARYPGWLYYDFPPECKKIEHYAGQRQRYFLARLRRSARVDLATAEPEFKDYRFVDFDELVELTGHFKQPLYLRVLRHFASLGLIRCS